ncbi:hypothetical protein QE152_g30484 [Popillia japonica]|uniref:Uncharacterized protein n=1 Tax=Popillia japonica TaxID=7064 RepID=A0AAW1JEG9_POPJA
MQTTTQVLLLLCIIASAFGSGIQKSFVRLCEDDRRIPFSIVSCLGVMGNKNHVVFRYSCFQNGSPRKFLMVNSERMDCKSGKRIDFSMDNIAHIIPSDFPPNYNESGDGYGVIRINSPAVKHIKPIVLAVKPKKNEVCWTFCGVKMVPNLRAMQDPRWTVNVWQSELKALTRLVKNTKDKYIRTCHANTMDHYHMLIKQCFLSDTKYSGCFELESGVSPNAVSGAPIVCGEDTVYGFVDDFESFRNQRDHIIPFEYIYQELIHFLSHDY